MSQKLTNDVARLTKRMEELETRVAELEETATAGPVYETPIPIPPRPKSLETELGLKPKGDR